MSRTPELQNAARRRALREGARMTTLAVTAALGLKVMQAPAAEELRIKLTVKRFEYSQKEIRVKKDVPVVIEITSEDVPHGFSIPDFKVRADVVLPGKVTEVRFTPDKVGQFQYLCDIFCGTRHEEVDGTLIVTA